MRILRFWHMNKHADGLSSNLLEEPSEKVPTWFMERKKPPMRPSVVPLGTKVDKYL